MTTYKAAIFFDLDGTLLNEQSVIPEENKQAIAHLQQQQILPIIASGRAPFEIEAITAGLGIDNYVSLNGQYVKFNGQLIQPMPIKPSLIKSVQALATSHHHSLALYSDVDYYINFIEKSAIALYDLDNAPLPKIDEHYYLRAPIYMLYLFTQDPHLDEQYLTAFQDDLSFVRDSPYSMAIVLKGISKKAGMTQLLAALNQANLPTYAFGDGQNDLPMFELVDTSIAMGNASELVKSQADYITDTNLNGGIIKALDRFHLLPS